MSLAGALAGILLFWGISWSAVAAETTGEVCLGRNLAKTASEQSDRLYLRVGDSPKIFFSRPYQGPVRVAQGLDLDQVHLVQVYFDDERVHSWQLDFSGLESRRALIWRAAGAWRMDPMPDGVCR